MPNHLVCEAARAAIDNFGEGGFSLRSVYRLHQGSNVWKIHCSSGERDIELCLYIFAGASLEQITSKVQHRLDSAL